MSVLDKRLIGALLHERSWVVVAQHQVTAKDLLVADCQATFRLCEQHFIDHGQVPSLTFVREAMGDQIDYPPPEDNLSALCAEVKRRTLENGLGNLLEEAHRALEGGDDPTGVLSRLVIERGASLRDSCDNQQNVLVGNVDASPFLRDYERAQRGEMAEMTYPWPSLNNATRGIHNDEVVFIYGLPKTLKTFVLQYICNHLMVQHQKRVLFISQEMGLDAVQRRAIAFFMRADYQQIRAGKLPKKAEKDLREDLDVYATLPPMLITTLRGQGSDAVAELEALIQQHRAEVVFYDGVYLSAENWEEMTQLTRALKRLAKSRHVAVLGTCQENAQGQTMYSRSFAQDCDLLLRTVRSEANRANDEILIQVPALREAALDNFTINALPCIDFSEKYLDGEDGQTDDPFM